MKTVPKNAIRFCKLTIAGLIWCSFAFKDHVTLMIVLVLLMLSALLKISRAPLILFYAYTVERIFPGPAAEVNVSAMRFAHSLGTLLSLICLIALFTIPSVGWWMVLGFAILKTISTIGFCPGEALYSCYRDGSCSILRS